MPCRVARLFCAMFLCCSAVALAQEASSDPPAHVSYVDGGAVLERDGEADASPENMPILAGDRIRTNAGRVEVLFADGSALHLDANTTVDFQSDELLRLLEGRIRLSIPGPDRQVTYRIDAPAGSVDIDSPGDYRVSIRRTTPAPEVQVEVLRGSAELVNELGRTPLRAGQRAAARAEAAPSYAYAFNSAFWDAFDRWSEARRDQRLALSTQYLPEEVRPYAASFDRAGDWRYEASYGYVWYPTVSTGWRPYRDGRWVSLRPYGWTWVGGAGWDWPTHHYGRWGLSAGAWFWIPGRSWAPAWVSWAYAPGYVSWCPLGWNNRPVLQFVNTGNRGHDPWRAWTAVPDRHFGRGYVRDVVARNFTPDVERGFTTRDTAPDTRAHAVPRSSAPIRIAGTGGVRRGASPVYTNLDPGGARVGGARSRTIVGPSRAIPAPSAAAEASDAPDRARPRDTRASVTGGPSGSRPGELTADPYGARARSPQVNGVARDRISGVPSVGGNPVRQGDPRAAQPGVTRGEENRAEAGSIAGTPPSSGVRARQTGPYGYPQYGAPRAVPRENPMYRPNPAPSESGGTNGTNAVRTPAPAPPAGDTRPHDGPIYGRPMPGARTSEPGSEVGRAVPRAEPRAERPAADPRPAPESRPSGGVQRSAPPAQPPAAAPAGSGHTRAGGRAR